VFDLEFVLSGNDIVYRYDLGSSTNSSCHYHGYSYASSMSSVIGSSTSFVFVFDFFLSTSTDISTGSSSWLAQFVSRDINQNNQCRRDQNPVDCMTSNASLTTPRGVWLTASLSSQARSVGGITLILLYPGGCFTTLASSGFILYRNPRAFVSCAPGFFLSRGADLPNACIQCPAGSFCVGHSLPPQQCLANTYSALSSASCSSNCPAGFKVDVQQCVACPTGEVSTSGFSMFCKNVCPPGSYFKLGTSECPFCPAGYFSNVFNATACMLCPKCIYLHQVSCWIILSLHRHLSSPLFPWLTLSWQWHCPDKLQCW
jgi:hypothetical protein